MKFLIILTIAILMSVSVLAGEKKQKTQTVDFTGETIDGTAWHPDAAYINQKRAVDFVPLYKVREHFDENIRNSVDFLK